MKLIFGNYEAWLWEGIFYVRYFSDKASNQFEMLPDFPRQESQVENWNRFNAIIAEDRKTRE